MGVREMKGSPRGEELKLLVRLLRGLRDWEQVELAAAAGMEESSICHYETGKTVPPRKTLERLVAAVGLPMPYVDGCLLPALKTALRLTGQLAEPDLADLENVWAGLGDVLKETARSTVAAFLSTLEEREALEQPGTPAAEDRRQAQICWSRLEICTPEERRYLVETCREFQTWAFAERLCHASEDAASDRPDRALELAGLACRVADLSPVSKALRLRLQGYALAYLANARRVANDLPGAEETLGRAWKLWEAGAQADTGLLEKWRLLDLEASLHRGRRRFREALDKLDQARASAPPDAIGRILMKKAYTLDQMGQAELAVEVLREAAPLVDSKREPRLRCVVKFNLAANLCHLGRYAEAESLLPEIQELAAGLRKELDLVRVAWLHGRIGAGLGRTREAATAFEQVRREFTARTMAYDVALVTLELAELYLAEGRTREVRALAEEMMWVFRSQGIQREALVALKLFFDAALSEAATVEMARRVLADVEEARRSGTPA